MSTQRITARFNGKCAGGCGKPTIKDSTIEYDYETKKVYHQECAQGVGNPAELPLDLGDSIALAESLGFKPHGEI